MINSLINGVVTDYLSSQDRAIHYGDGLFETILCHKNNLYYWPQHYLRLKQSAEKINMSCPDESILLSDITKLLSDNESDKTYAIKIILTRGLSQRGYEFNKKTTVNRLVFISTIEKDYSSLLALNLLSGDLSICKQQVSINENLAGLKHLNRLDNVLARNESAIIDNKKVIDGLMLNANKHVIEGAMSNVFMVKDKQLYTPKLNQSGVYGVMREVIIDIAKTNKIEVIEKHLFVDDVNNMDELFITNSLIGMKAINYLNGIEFSGHAITAAIFNNLLNDKDSYVQTL